MDVCKVKVTSVPNVYESLDKSEGEDVTLHVNINSQEKSESESLESPLEPQPEIKPIEKINHVPNINCEKTYTLTRGSVATIASFKITASDLEDGDLTDKIKYTITDFKEVSLATDEINRLDKSIKNPKNNIVDTSKLGVYSLKLSVADSKGAKVTKIINITIIQTDSDELENPVIAGNDISIYKDSTFNIDEMNIKAINKNGEDISKKLEIDTTKVNVHTVGDYEVMASIKDIESMKVTNKFIVHVKYKPSSSSSHRPYKFHKPIPKPESVKSIKSINEAPHIYCDDLKLFVGDKFTVQNLHAKAMDKNDRDITDKIKYTGLLAVDTTKVGQYAVGLSVEDSEGVTTKKNIKVLVEHNIENTLEIQFIDNVTGENITAIKPQPIKTGDRLTPNIIPSKVLNNLTSKYTISHYNVNDKDYRKEFNIIVIPSKNIIKVYLDAIKDDISTTVTGNIIINGHNITIEKGQEFNISDMHISVYNKDTNKFIIDYKVLDSNVNTNKVGTYKIIVVVNGNDGTPYYKPFTVAVINPIPKPQNDKDKPIINKKPNSIKKYTKIKKYSKTGLNPVNGLVSLIHGLGMIITTMLDKCNKLDGKRK